MMWNVISLLVLEFESYWWWLIYASPVVFHVVLCYSWTCISLIHRPRSISKCLNFSVISAFNKTCQMPKIFIFSEASFEVWAPYRTYSVRKKKFCIYEYGLIRLSHPSAATIYLQTSLILLSSNVCTVHDYPVIIAYAVDADNNGWTNE